MSTKAKGLSAEYKKLCSRHGALVAKRFSREPPHLTPAEQKRLDVIRQKLDALDMERMGPSLYDGICEKLDELSTKVRKVCDLMGLDYDQLRAEAEQSEKK